MIAFQRSNLNEKLAENSEFLAEKYPSGENFINFMSKRFHFAAESSTRILSSKFTNSTAGITSDVIPTQNMTSSCWFGCALEGAEDVLTGIFTLLNKMKNYVYFCLVVILLILVCVLLNKIIKTFLYCTRIPVTKDKSYHCQLI